MATQTLALPAAGGWTEVVAALSLTVGESYLVEPRGAAVEVVETDSAGPAAGARGRILFPGRADRPVDVRRYTVAAGVELHARAFAGERALLVVDDSS